MDAELQRELQFHVEQEMRERVSLGESHDLARRSVARNFGSIARVREECRDTFDVPVVSDLWRDVKYAWRTMARTSGLAVAVASLALAAGATSAVYGTADWLLFRSTDAVRDPAQLVTLRVTDRDKPDWGPYGFAWDQFLALQHVQDGFTEIASFAKILGVASNDARADQLVFEYVTGNYLSMLGVRPFLGRTLMPEDDVDGAPPVVTVSYNYWTSRLGGTPDVVGQAVRLNGQAATIVGVLPRDFDGYETPWNGPTSVWIPMRAVATIGRSTVLTRSTSFFPVVARMRPGMNVDQIREKAQVWLREIPVLRMPTWSANMVAVIPSDAMRTGGRGRQLSGPFFVSLLIVCGLIFIAASFNVANFLIGRAVARRHELALRAAIGASRMRVARQLLAEAALVGVMASAVAVVITIVVARVLAPLPRVYLHLPPTADGLTTAAAIDAHMLGIALAMGIGSALFFGTVPALTACPNDPVRALKDPRPRWTWSSVRITLRQAVLVVQVAMTITLAVTAGLYLRAFLRAASVPSDYSRPQSVLVAHVVATSLPVDRRSVFYRSLLERLNERDDVVSASIGWNPPFSVGRNPVAVPERTDAPITSRFTAAAPRFFEAAGVRVLRGREFDGSEDDARRGLIINRHLAERLWPGSDAVGQRVRYGSVDGVVIGVVAQDRCDGLLGEVQPCGWQAFPMNSSMGYVRIRIRGEPLAFTPILKDIVRKIDPDAATSEEASLSDLIADEIGGQRLAAFASSGLALFGIVLLSVGSASLFQSMVQDSRKEIAIRMAIGASRATVATRVIVQGLMLSILGTALGLVLARLLALRIAPTLYQIGPADPFAFVLVPTAVVAIGLAGVAWSALTAARTEPVRYLQAE